MSAFDIVIIGGGSAGCVLAGRLSEDPALSVCLVEAGGEGRSVRVRTPVALVDLMRNARYNWLYESAPQRELGNRCLGVPRGKVLGGSSAINSMVYIRGRASDYDRWAALGCDGWDWKSVLPVFRRAENNQRIENDLHGNSGPLIVGDLPSPHPLCRTWIEAGEYRGIPRNDDFNGAAQEGLGTYQVTMHNGRRVSAADAYLSPARSRPNLTVLTNAHALRIEFAGRRATGVAVVHDGQFRTIRVRDELLLSAGAIGSPALLLASGVGPEAELARMGVEVVQPLAGVGENLQEHVSIGMSLIAPAGRGLSLATLPSIAWAPVEYLVRGTGLLSTNHVEAGGFARTDLRLAEPDVQFHMIPARVGVASKGIVWGRGYFADACLLRPASRGRLSIRKDGRGFAPVIDFNALGHADDRAAIVRAFRLLRSILESEPFERLRPVEESPGAAVQTDEQILRHCRQRLGTAYHPVGTCRMGPGGDPRSVVGPDLRVVGLENLRIADASIMPEIIAGNTNAPTMMIGDMAADLILSNRRDDQ